MKQIFFSVATGSLGLLALFIALLLAPPAARAQAPAWETVITAGQARSGSSNVVSVSAMTADTSGNVYVAGSFRGTVGFGSITLTSLDVNDVFVAKWSNSSKSFAWALRTGGSGGYNGISAIAVRGANVYIAGVFCYLSRFGSITVDGAGGSAFVAKLTDAGPMTDFTWVRKSEGSPTGNSYYASALAVNGTSVYVAGYFSGPTVSFGSTTLVNKADSHGYSNLFVAKLTDAGLSADFVWAQGGGGAHGYDEATALAVLETGVYVAGTFSSKTVRFGPAELANAGETGSDGFVAKLTDAGSSASFAWAQRTGGTGDDKVRAVAVRKDNVYVAGNFASPTLGLGTTTLTKEGSRNNGFVAKLTDAGSDPGFVWAQQVGSRDNYVAALAVNAAGVYIAGGVSGPASFGTVESPSPDGGPSDVYVAKLADAGPTGAFLWAQRTGGFKTNSANSIALNGKTVYVGGNVTPPATFGQLAINSSAAIVPFFATLRDAPAAPAAYRLNAGGGALATTRGAFAADQYYSADSRAFATTAPVAGTPDPALYQSERYSTNGRLAYALPVANGTYTVVLHFAEIYWQQVGQRVFDVSLEGSKVLDDYDIAKKVGPNTATTETFVVAVADGVLNLDFSALAADGGVDQAKLSALEVQPASAAYRLNAGGGALATSRGAFSADQYYSADSRVFATTAPVAGTPDPALYQTERYSAGGRIAYALPVANGAYTVVLHFAEIYWQQVGQRLFDVSLEGNKVLDNYDIVKKVGPLTATTETFAVAVADGVLNVNFSALAADGGVDQAKVSAIEVFSGTGSAGASSRLVASRGAPAGAVADQATAFSAYPNPTSGRFTAACTAGAAQEATLLLTDPLGRVAQQQRVQLQPGRNEVVLQAGAQAPGLYLLTLRTADGQRQRLKVLVQP